jgi:hypothetical protein
VPADVTPLIKCISVMMISLSLRQDHSVRADSGLKLGHTLLFFYLSASQRLMEI